MTKLNEQSLKLIDEITQRHVGKAGPIKLMLHDVQHELGYIPVEAMEKIAVACNTSVADVYGVVTFYTQFTTEPKGKYVVNVCLGTACYVKGAQGLLELMALKTGCEVNATTADGLFSLDATRCLGACGLAPVATVNGKVYGNALEDKAFEQFIDEVLKERV